MATPRIQKFLYLNIAGLIASFLIILSVHESDNAISTSHNCRFYGITFTSMSSLLADTLRTHLDSLRSLSINNDDGWGFGYFMAPDTQDLLGIIVRGEPMASLDPRYVNAVENMIKYAQNCAVAHVRSGSSGPTSGIPDPHPFLRESLNREFKMLFAHNGNIPIKELLAVINNTNPLYLRLNPPDYAPDHVDSDLYAIFIMEIIDTYINLPIDECIQIAVTRIDSAIGLSAAKYNFVMTDGTKLWALHFNKSTTDQATLHLYPNVSESSFWIAASTPLDTFNILWAEIPNSTLVVLTPNESPRLIRIFDNEPLLPPAPLFDIVYPNPFREKIRIRFQIPNQQNADLRIYDAVGRLVAEFNGLADEPSNSITWDGRDMHDRESPSGIYYCTLNISGNSYTKKIILMK